MEKFFNITACLVLFVFITFIYQDGLSKVNWDTLTIADYHQSEWSRRHDIMYLIDTPGCKIPNYDAFDLSIRKRILPGKFLNCKTDLAFIKLIRTCFQIDWRKVNGSEYKNSFSFCRIHTIYRPRSGQHHNYFQYINGTVLNKKPVCVKSDMVRVQCFDKKNASIYTNFFWIYQKNETLEAECDERFKKRKENPNITETLSVLLLGVDSTSRLNSHRFLVKTRQALLQNFVSVEMLGQNIVGGDTFNNLVPMLAGKSKNELKKDGKFSNTPMDNFDFIWKDYEKNGFRTLFAEDSAWIALFDYLKPGFRTFPTHFFNRPWSVAWESVKGKCKHGWSEPAAILEYLTKFVSVYKAKPYFAFTFLTTLTHDEQEYAAELDEIVSKFFVLAYKGNAFNNTIVFFFGDHGMRYGAARSTDIGTYEAQSPMMFIIVPKWFSEKYKTIMRNLRKNARKLTTMYDVHETLLNILNFNGRVIEYNSTRRGESLFSDVSDTRNCSDVGSSDSMCTCSQYTKVQNQSEILATQNLSLKIVSEINALLKNHKTLCAQLSLYKTVSIYRAVSLKKLLSYKITIQTLPGKGLFEAPVFHDLLRDEYRVGQILRVNRYGDQSKCIDDYILRNYCFCKEQ